MNGTTSLGRVGGAVAESLAYLNSPAAIDGEIRRLERAQAGGDRTEATRALLADWRAVREAQRRLLAEEAA
jgi:putative ubiquitin-RnfH superfamily antitoxin RatB of RatAB toxin-antitoxin module